ncbi:hypothetical protein PV327_001989 [Microctonus hyperodae]|uniref:Uncharacterized protein n=1 Tax=Microctonus hyperodae TaxID=165561 RepID=A0AA39KNV1_MICHY|nr:hypothetical protein PV327_001989 [Microctonus hyperodae]
MVKKILPPGSYDIESRVITIGLLHIVFAALLIKSFGSDDTNYNFVFFCILLPPLVVQILISLIMIIGTVPRKLNCIFPFICMCFGNIITFIPIGIAFLIYTSINLPSKESWFGDLVLNLLKTAVISGGYIYVFITVFTFYQIVLREKYSPVKTDKTQDNDKLESISSHL